MEDRMMPEAREAMAEKIMEKLKIMPDDELMTLAEDLGVDEDAKKAEPPLLMTQATPVVDTGVLTGPMPSLKNFLLKSQRDKEAKS